MTKPRARFITSRYRVIYYDAWNGRLEYWPADLNRARALGKLIEARSSGIGNARIEEVSA